jgi:hypothetical protein
MARHSAIHAAAHCCVWGCVLEARRNRTERGRSQDAPVDDARSRADVRTFGIWVSEMFPSELEPIPLLMGSFQSDRGIGNEMVKITGRRAASWPQMDVEGLKEASDALWSKSAGRGAGRERGFSGPLLSPAIPISPPGRQQDWPGGDAKSPETISRTGDSFSNIPSNQRRLRNIPANCPSHGRSVWSE